MIPQYFIVTFLAIISIVKVFILIQLIGIMIF